VSRDEPGGDATAPAAQLAAPGTRSAGIDAAPPVLLDPSRTGVADFEALARERLDDRAWAYFSGGAGDEHTLAANRAAWRALSIVPRVAVPLAGGDTAVELLGRRWPTPLLLAPVAHQRLAHPDGERATALAAAAQGTGVVLSAQASVPLEDVAELVRGDAGRGPLWMQLLPHPDRGFLRALAQRAAAAGFDALVLTMDAPLHGVRDRERRAGFALPPGLAAVNPADAPPRPQPASRFDYAAAHAASWSDVGCLASASALPLLVKGVLHEADARAAVAAGAAGVVVSNHGGRTLDGTVATARVLPRIVDAVGHRVPVLVDGGLRRGSDVLKALALGARAVLLGRAQVMALATAGAPGVALWLRLLRDELETALVLAGCRTPADASRGLLFDGD
jgi:4-hydroxymandelate oxidase